MQEATRQRLLDRGVDVLVELVIDDTLATPIRELVDVPWLAHALADALRAGADDPTVERMVRDQLRVARQHTGSGPIPVPPELKAPIEALVGRIFIPDRQLVGAILEHEGARVLLKGLLEDSLIAFAARLKPPTMPTPRGLPNLGALGKLGSNVLGVVGHEFERQVQVKAREFLAVAVHKLTSKMADQLCDPDAAEVYAAWRVYGVQTVLATDRQVLAAEVEKLDPEALAGSALELVRAFVARPTLTKELEKVLRELVEQAGEKTLRETLGGVETHGIGIVREILRARMRAVIQTDAFAVWWDEMVG